MKTKTKKMIRIGVVGVGRGETFAAGATESVGLKLVALCDTWEERLKEAGKRHGVATYTDFERFLEHDMDAVVLANYFHQHAPLAIKALKAGKHVMSETAANTTLGEAVALCKAVEESGKIYMLAENYPYTVFNQEMRRLYRTGEIGQVTYADGEYNHPMSPSYWNSISPGEKHWRNHVPPTYYCTHALAPLMYITDTRPVQVNSLSLSFPELNASSARVTDAGSVILCRMDNGAVFRLFGLFMPGHSCWYRVHGTHGAMESVRGPGYFGSGQVRVWHEEWDRNNSQTVDRTILPEWPEHTELADRSGHGGGDFWTNYHFAQAIKTGKQPYLDVYRAVAMSSIGVLAWRSCLKEGGAVAVPDFRDKRAREVFADDHESPWPDGTGTGTLPSSIIPNLAPSPAGLAIARKQWKAIGYDDNRTPPGRRKA